ncbi:MAG TPA: hypothetical protein VFX50_03665 [Gemmatimonadales bacterium]|nr:hypothetical protein [Gemmatimonadales bacterium]
MTATPVRQAERTTEEFTLRAARRGWRTRLRRVGEGAFLLLIAAVAFELTARVEDRIRYGTPVLSGYTDQSQLIVRDRTGMHGRPGARYRKFVLNNHGFRGPDITEAPAPGVARVLVVGASETFGLGESPGKEYPRQLEDSLAARIALLRQLGVQRIEVVNAAMLGMSLPTLVEDVRHRLGKFGPAIMVAYPTPVQYLMDQRPVAARPDSTVVEVPEPSPWRLRSVPRLYEQTKQLLPARLARALRARDIDRTVSARPPGWVFDTIPEERVAAYEEDLRAFVGAARAIGAEPILMAHANVFSDAEPRDEGLLTAWRRFYPRASEAVLVDFDRRVRGVTCRVAADSGVSFVNLDAHLDAPRKRYFADYSHFSDAGAGLVAGLLAGAVEQRLSGVRLAAVGSCPG